MTRYRPAILAGIALVTLAATSASPSADDVQALVTRAAAYIRQYGQEQAFRDFTRPDGGFVVGELYIFCNDDHGVVLAHGGNPKLLGKSLFPIRDAEGKQPIQELNAIAHAAGQGWLEYLWPNPETGRIQHKVSYVVEVDKQTFCGSGYYKPETP
jgi:signal transduction histidine kinase